MADARHDRLARPVPRLRDRTADSLPEAVRVLDAFHVVRLGKAAVDDVRRRRPQETLGWRGHREDPLYRGRRLLRRGFTTLNQRQWSRLESTLTVGDPVGS
jgi:transposase